MFKKGFTLIELLGVIILLGVISLIAYPIINNTIKESKEKAYKEIVNNIEQVAYHYSVEHDLGEPSIFKKLPLQELKNEGYLKNNEIINPINNEPMNGCVKYKWNDATKKYIFEYSDTCIFSTDDSCFEYEDVSVVVSYDIDYDRCVATFTDSSSTVEEIAEFEKICSNEYRSKELNDMTIKEYINYNLSASLDSFSQFESMNLFKNVVKKDGVRITKYKCGAKYIGEDSSGKRTFEKGEEMYPIIPERIGNKEVVTIGPYAFCDHEYATVLQNSYVNGVTISNSVIYIEEKAFFGNELDNVNLSDSIKIIGYGSFMYHTLVSITLPKNLSFLGPYAFAFGELENVDFKGNLEFISSAGFMSNKIRSVFFPNTLKYVSEDAFYNNSLEDITIPNSVEILGDGAFFKTAESNRNLVNIINETGRTYNWGNIINGSSGYIFETGTVVNNYGNVIVTK